jgi:hypothetical protein
MDFRMHGATIKIDIQVKIVLGSSENRKWLVEVRQRKPNAELKEML